MPDLLAEYHFNNTPYNYCLNNPISRIDPFGLNDTLGTVEHPIPILEVTITGKAPEKKKSKSNSSSSNTEESGINVTSSSGTNGTNPNAKTWFDLDFDLWDAILKLFGGRHAKAPSDEKKVGKSVNVALKTSKSDKEIAEEAGNNKQVIQNELDKRKGIIEDGKGKYKGWKGKEALSGTTYTDPSGDSTLLVTSKGDSLLYKKSNNCAKGFEGCKDKIPLK